VVLLLVAKAMYIGGVYDTWAEVTFVHYYSTLNFKPFLGYYSSFSIWWRWLVVSVNNMEDVIGGHVWVGALCLLVVSGIFSQNHLLGTSCCLSGEDTYHQV
jgi:photosystem II CP43 chlorophyll apoprotein